MWGGSAQQYMFYVCVHTCGQWGRPHVTRISQRKELFYLHANEWLTLTGAMIGATLNV